MTMMESGAPAPDTTYVAPRIVVMDVPRPLTTFCEFTVTGRVAGSEVDGAEVEVCAAGVTRTGVVADGVWAVAFEAGALTHRHVGVRPITGRVMDASFNCAEATRWVTIDEFVEGYVHVDGGFEVTGGAESDGELIATGELALGTHEQGRGLEVALVRAGRDAAPAPGAARGTADEYETVVTGAVEPGWHHGEWVARLPLRAVHAGTYRVRARLVDCAAASLTRQMVGRPFTLG